MNININKCPCKDCICIPICRNRHVDISIKKCTLLDDYVEANSKRYKPLGIRITLMSTLQEINRVFKWGSYYGS